MVLCNYCVMRYEAISPKESFGLRDRLNDYIVRYLSLQSLIAAEATSFLLIEKKQKIKPEKTFHLQAKHLGPVFRQAFTRLG